MESFGVLFGSNVKMYVYPSLVRTEGELYSCQNFKLDKEELYYLFQYIYSSNKIEDIRDVKEELLHITSDDVLAMIKRGEEGWEEMVPDVVEKAVKQEGLFGFQLSEREKKEFRKPAL